MMSWKKIVVVRMTRVLCDFMKTAQTKKVIVIRSDSIWKKSSDLSRLPSSQQMSSACFPRVESDWGRKMWRGIRNKKWCIEGSYFSSHGESQKSIGVGLFWKPEKLEKWKSSWDEVEWMDEVLVTGPLNFWKGSEESGPSRKTVSPHSSTWK